MLFNSWVFLAFFAVVLALYALMQRRVAWQNAMLLVASYVFYGWWDWRFLGLVLLSTVVDYVAALRIQAAPTAALRRRWLTLSMVSNLGVLAGFKYFGFFLDSLRELLMALGIEAALPTLSIVLPVGISFYTFQTMSYTIDVYRRELPACTSFRDFALYVTFFPQLVAGPIERSVHLLPQMQKPRKLTAEGVEAGLFLCLWGLFKKVVVADNAAAIADPIFSDPSAHSGDALLLGALAFTAQIYGDFSGYSDMARGLAKILGFELMINFKLPYFAVSPSDFWRRWHVSLSSWLRDYLYIPLGGNRGGSWATQRNLMLTMTLGGLWHGAAWNFVIWGVYHGLLLILYRGLGSLPGPRLPARRWWADLVRVSTMFPLTVIGWIIFRVDSVAGLRAFASGAWVSNEVDHELAWATLAAIWLPVLLMQLAQLARDDLLVPMRLPAVLRGILYGLLIAACVALGTGESKEFIYFQF